MFKTNQPCVGIDSAWLPPGKFIRLIAVQVDQARIQRPIAQIAELGDVALAGGIQQADRRIDGSPRDGGFSRSGAGAGSEVRGQRSEAALAIAGTWPRAIALGSSTIPAHRATEAYPIGPSNRIVLKNIKILP